MHIAKPSWVVHEDDKKKKSTIFSIHVHPDCSRLATGSLDTKIRIWSTLPILSEAIAANEANPKLLCTLALHNGPVLTVRWAHHGRYLASGSDDGVVMIWDLDPSGGGKVWGSDDVNVENWKPLKRLVGHESDVADLAWNTDDTMIASVGLDSTVFIWDGYNFAQLRKIDQHQGFVKGVCWDPVGQYLATQSDDKSVKIWSTEDWALTASIDKPFQQSPGNTFFRRLSWSPDGAFIAASNAMNGPVFVAAVIDRDEWESDISFVGHENTIQVAAFNPRLFRDPEDLSSLPVAMLALGADDNSISIWKNSKNHPLVVIKDLFERQILDLSWSNDGLSLYGCSSDGTICAITFDKNEVPDLCDPEAARAAVEKYGYINKRPARARQAPLLQVPAFMPGSSQRSQVSEINTLVAKPAPQKVTIMANGKRRIQPSLIATLASTEAMSHAEPMQTMGAFAAAAEQPLESQSRIDVSRQALLQDAPVMFAADSNAENAREMRTIGAVQQRAGDRSEERHMLLPVPAVQGRLDATSEDGSCQVAAMNGAASASVSFRSAASTWQVPSAAPVIAIACSQRVIAAATEAAVLLCYSTGGSSLFGSLKLDAAAAVLDVCDRYVMVVSARGTVYVWDTLVRRACLDRVSIADLLNATPSSSTSAPPSVTGAQVRPNGNPLVQLSNGSSYVYDGKLQSWVELFPLAARSGGANVSAGQNGIVSRLSEAASTAATGADRSVQAVDLAEERLRASTLLHASAAECRAAVRQYGLALVQDELGGRLDDLLAELWGPLYHASESAWEPTMCGLSKRALAVELLGGLTGSGATLAVVAEWHRIVQRARAQGYEL